MKVRERDGECGTEGRRAERHGNQMWRGWMPALAAVPSTAMSTHHTREAVALRILNGETLFVLNGNLIAVPHSWLSSHPGGALSILHLVGRDATDEVQAYHPDHVLKRMLAFSQGPVQLSEDGWVPLLPPIFTGWYRKLAPDGSFQWHNEAMPEYSSENTSASPSSQVLLVKNSGASPGSGPSLASIQPPATTLSLKRQSQHSAAYKQLHKRIVDAGLYQTRYISGYGPEVARYVFFALSAFILYRNQWFFLSAVSLGALWHQLVFFCHDLGHVGFTHNWQKDRLIAIFLADFIGGVSIGWWVNVRTFRLFPSHRLTLLQRITTSITVRFSGDHGLSLPDFSFQTKSRHESSVTVCLHTAPSSFAPSRLPVTQISNTSLSLP
jgi:hypothetical protein